MNRNKKVNPSLRTFIFLSSVVVIMIAAAYGLFYYVFSIPEPEGLSLASWPDTFTDNFSFRGYRVKSTSPKILGLATTTAFYP